MNTHAKQFALLTAPGFCNVILVLDPNPEGQFVVGSIAVPGPTESIVVSPDGERAYVTHFEFLPRPGGLLVIDLASQKVIAEVPLERGGFHDLAISPDGKHAYVTSGKVVSVVDTSTNTVEATVPIDVGFPTWIAITPNGKQAYVGNVDFSAPPGKEQLPISVIDTTLKKVVATIPVAANAMAIAPDGKAYATEIGAQDQNVAVIDTANNTVVARVQAGVGPWAIAVTPDGKKVWVSNQGPLGGDPPNDSTISVIDTGTNQVMATFHVSFQPNKVFFTPDGQFGLVTFLEGDFTPLGGGIVEVINTTALPNPAFGVASTEMRIGHVVGGIGFAELREHDANAMRDARAERARLRDPGNRAK
jgi:YVTN family beta-propeller protein